MTDDELLDELADAIVKHGLGGAALIAIRSAPVLGSQAQIALRPILGAVWPARAAELAPVLEQPGASGRLAERIAARQRP